MSYEKLSMNYTEFEILQLIKKIKVKKEIEKIVNPYSLQSMRVNCYIREVNPFFAYNSRKYELTKLGEQILEEYKRQGKIN